MLSQSTFIGFIPVHDTDVARRFYEQVLGLQVVEDTPSLSSSTPTTRGRGSPQCPSWSPQPFTIAGWQVSDITATARTLADRGSPLFVGDQPEQGEDPALLVPDHHLVGDVEILDAEATRSAERNHRVERNPGQVTDFSPVSDDLVELGALLVREKDRRIGID